MNWEIENILDATVTDHQRFHTQQACKPRNYASSKLRLTDRPIDSLLGMKCRATSEAKKKKFWFPDSIVKGKQSINLFLFGRSHSGFSPWLWFPGSIVKGKHSINLSLRFFTLTLTAAGCWREARISSSSGARLTGLPLLVSWPIVAKLKSWSWLPSSNLDLGCQIEIFILVAKLFKSLQRVGEDCQNRLHFWLLLGESL